jgi:predicted adenylyl cyclase CyaB
MTFEIELKIQLLKDEKKRLDNFLLSDLFSGEYIGKFEQIDHYFDTLIPSFARNDTALRVREEKLLEKPESNNLNETVEKSIEITYKGKKINLDSKTRIEYNLNFAPETDFETIQKFLNELGYELSQTIRKERKNFILDSEILISVDSNELGDFVEIEKIVEDKNKIKVTEDYLWSKIQEIIGQIPNERKIVKSYLELILENRKSIKDKT